MAHALSSLASATLFIRDQFHCRKFIHQRSRRCVIDSNQFWSSSGKRWLRGAGSRSAGRYGGISEVKESETSPCRYAWPNSDKRPRVCILGGGFGGLYTALRLESLDWPEGKKPQVVLIDQFDRFVFKPLLYELLSGEVEEWEIAPRFSDLLSNTSVEFFKDRVQSLHPTDHLGMDGASDLRSAGMVHLDSGVLIEYDWLVLALGAEAKLDVVPGAMEYALPFSTLEDARRINGKLKTLERKYFGKDSQIRVAVVGCGYSGVELAATVSERLQARGVVQAINVEKTILPSASPGNREHALKVLSSRNVQLLLGYFVRCIRRKVEPGISTELGKLEALDDTIKTDEKFILELQPAERGKESQIVEADLVLWTVGSKPLISQLEPVDKFICLPINGKGQVETEETLRVKGHPRVFAVGDSAGVREKNGIFQTLPRFQNLGEMMTLGRYDGAVSPSFIDGLTLDGPVGHSARKIAYLIRLPTDEHRIKVGISWLTKTVVESTALLQTTIAKLLSGQ